MQISIKFMGPFILLPFQVSILSGEYNTYLGPYFYLHHSQNLSVQAVEVKLTYVQQFSKLSYGKKIPFLKKM